MSDAHPRRQFLRLVTAPVTGAVALGAIAGCTDGEQAAEDSTPATWCQPSGSSDSQLVAFPPGPVTAGTQIPRLAEAGRLRSGARHSDLEVIWQIDAKQKLVALTFDDGPDPRLSGVLYDILSEARIKATFFLVGERVLKNAKLMHGRMDLHEVGNHTFRHESLFVKNDEMALKDLNDAHKAIASVTGKEPQLFRPPYSHLNGNTLLAAAAMGYDLVMWNSQIGYEGYENELQLAQDVVRSIAPGSIVLGHDAGEQRLISIRAMPKIISELKRMKYEFVTVSELRTAV